MQEMYSLQYCQLSAISVDGHFCQSVNSRALFAIRVICRMVLLAKFSELVWSREDRQNCPLVYCVAYHSCVQ